jgi:Ca2+-binding EF-hand superfamily protein
MLLGKRLRFVMGVALATLPLSVVTDAVGPNSASAQEGSPVKEPAALFKELDKNTDGKLSKDEVPEGQLRFHERLLRAAGKKEGDDLTQDEFVAALKEARPAPDAAGPRGPGGPGGPGGREMPTPEQMLERMDKNKDGKISKDEVPEPAQRFLNPLFERLGKDTLTKDDLAEAQRRMKEMMGRPGEGRPGEGRRPEGNPGAGRGEEFFKRLDTNGDGSITAAEAPEGIRPRVEAMLKEAGKEPSGSLSREEFVRLAMARMAADGRRPDGPPRGPEGRGPEGDRRPERPDGDRRPEGDRRPDGPPRGPEGDRRPDGPPRGPEGRGPEGDRRPDGPPRGPEGRGPEGRGPMGGPPFGPGRFPPGLARFDRNEDGRLNRDELERLVREFDEIDRNGDGQIEIFELMGFGPPGRGPEGRGPEGDRRPDGPPPRGPEGRGPEGRGPEGRRPEGDRRPDGPPPEGRERGREGDRPAEDRRPPREED